LPARRLSSRRSHDTKKVSRSMCTIERKTAIVNEFKIQYWLHIVVGAWNIESGDRMVHMNESIL